VLRCVYVYVNGYGITSQVSTILKTCFLNIVARVPVSYSHRIAGGGIYSFPNRLDDSSYPSDFHAVTEQAGHVDLLAYGGGGAARRLEDNN
jgi:hypothetical protein